MALTPTEIEAKIATLEDRISLLFQATEKLESQLERGEERWFWWAKELRAALAIINGQLERVRNNLLAKFEP